MNARKVFIAFSGVFCLISCGGGGSGSTNTTSVSPPPPPVNQAPVANVSTNKNLVTEGQNFILDALGSTDPEGETLTFSWSQISGSAVTIDTPSAGSQTLTAPLVDADENLEFQVQVTDGTNTSTANVSVNVSDLSPEEFRSESSAFSTVGLGKLSGLTPKSDGGFTAYWDSWNGSFNMPTSAQEFDSTGETLGNQIDGEFFTGFVEWGGNVQEVILSDGSPNYMIRTTRIEGLSPGFGPTFVGVSTHKDVLVGRVFEVGTEIFLKPSPDFDFYQQDSVATIQDSNLSSDHIISLVTADARPRIDAFGGLGQEDFKVHASILNSDGTDFDFELDTSPSPITGAAVAPLTSGNFIGLYNIIENGRSDLFFAKSLIDGSNISARNAVPESSTGNQDQPFVARLSSGPALMVWRDDTGSSTDSNGTSIQGRKIDAEGNFLGGQFSVNQTTAGDQSDPYIQALNEDHALVVWKDSSSGVEEIRAVTLNMSGETVSNEFLLATGSAALDAANFVSAHLSDDRVALGWNNVPSSIADRTSHLIVFDPR